MICRRFPIVLLEAGPRDQIVVIWATACQPIFCSELLAVSRVGENIWPAHHLVYFHVKFELELARALFMQTSIKLEIAQSVLQLELWLNLLF